MNKDEIYMQRCVQLALNGRANVSPNPMVGAVIVCDDEIIGEGYHVRCGDAHAEVNAIRSVKDVDKLKRSTIYVSLEPCSHYGKTPPCADLIIDKQIPRIVIGCRDPFSKVAGRGIQKLQDANREVIVGVLEEKCQQLIRNFILFHTLRRPYITLKWAESADGFIDVARDGGYPVILSTALTSMLVHQKRAMADAIMVGTQTALLDNPSLTVRNWSGNNPVRIVIDRQLALPSTLRLFDTTVPTLVYTTKEKDEKQNLVYVTLKDERDLLPQILNDLYKRGIQNLLVEGGSKLLYSFINAGLYDEIFVEKSRKRLYSGVKAPEICDKRSDSDIVFGGEHIWHYTSENPPAKL
ncbi:bifunctional diaminohydroxyphosphoribosylaminopyrimidine deaminase/5-amino-6-(5-phosphoribosylamino)uracil reductase RibD [Bacteroides sp. OttesenSCG-928-N06]|nr:bifunctional diaminohydroxyphosphoribosylaminopyrimidine deaminase/5-amino-6-(5-phosphoribosylamino)uracil reductase RibD [Bacteroides sp. OttesenSCG-928-N06]